jgi:hypothetical protein
LPVVLLQIVTPVITIGGHTVSRRARTHSLMPDKIKDADKIPFAFILDHILRDDIVIKPMFGCFAIYAGGKLCLFLVDRDVPIVKPDGETMDNGVHIATTAEHIDSLRPGFPDAEFRRLKDGKVWILIAVDHPLFEEHVVKACEMINAHDQRIGR